MSTETPPTGTISQGPPVEQPIKRSFVDPSQFPSQKEQEKLAEKPQQPVVQMIKVGDEEVALLKPEVALTLIYGKISKVLIELQNLNDIFQKASAKATTFQNIPPQPIPMKEPTTSQPKPELAPTTSQPPVKAPTVTAPPPTELPPRVKEIVAALESVSNLLNIDTESSTMFVMVKPSQFLGSENFAKVASIVRGIGGQYVSAGKNSHFEIPKTPLQKH